MESSRKLQSEMNSHINKPRSLEDDKELFERFKPGLEWKDENLVNKCAGCSSKFTIVKRKHHCRECGDVFCNSCSLHKNVIQGVLKRCCTSCYHRTVAESKHSMIGNHLDMDYDDNIAVGDGSVSSYRSASFAKAVHIVDSMQSPARGKKGKAAASTTSQQQPSNFKAGEGKPGEAESGLPPWVEALVYVAKEGDEEDFEDEEEEGGGGRVERRCVLYPPEALSRHIVADISKAAMPYTSGEREAGVGSDGSAGGMNDLNDDDDAFDGLGEGSHMPCYALNYMFRTHDKTEGGLVGVINTSSSSSSSSSSSRGGLVRAQRFDKPRIASCTVFLNGFVCYREVRDKKEGGGTVVRKHALVFVSKWPFPQLAYYVMKRLDSAFRWCQVQWSAEQQKQQQALSASIAAANTIANAAGGSNAKTGGQVPLHDGTVKGRMDLAVTSMTEVMKKCYSEFSSLPQGKAGELMQGSFLGEMLQYRVPVDIAPLLGGVNLNMSACAVTYNLVQCLAPLGLVQHLFTLWELVASGRDIVVVAPNPAQCAELVLTLSSLLSPIGHAGVVSPYLHSRDSDLDIIAELSLRKQQREREREGVKQQQQPSAGGGVSKSISINDLAQATNGATATSGGSSSAAPERAGGGFGQPESSVSPSRVSPTKSPRGGDGVSSSTDTSAVPARKPIPRSARRLHRLSSIIVGVSDPDALETLGAFDAAIFVRGGAHSVQSLSSIRESLRRRKRARHLVAESEGLAPLYEGWLKSGSANGGGDNAAAAGGGGGGDDDDEDGAIDANGASDGGRALLVTRTQFETELDREVIRKIQNMDTATSMRVLGDKLIRDRLNVLTIAFYTPEDNTTLEIAEMRLSAMEKAALLEETRHADKVLKMVATEGGLFDLRDLTWLLTNLATGVPFLVPTVVMWLCYLVSASVAVLVLDVSLEVLLVAALMGQFPVECPKTWERVLRLVLPKHILYPAHFDKDGNRKKGLTSAAILSSNGDSSSFARLNSERSVGSEDSEQQLFKRTNTSSSTGSAPGKEGGGGSTRARANLSGVWSRKRTVDYDKFIMAQGGSWLKSRLASTIELTHTITMDENLRFFRLQEKGGPINTDIMYNVDGVTVTETTISEAKFKDIFCWDDDNVLSGTKLVQPNEQYELVVKRYLDDTTHMRIVATYNNFGEPSKNVTATSFFERTGPSPMQDEMDQYASANPPVAGAVAVTATATAGDGAGESAIATDDAAAAAPAANPAAVSSSDKGVKTASAYVPAAAAGKSKDKADNGTVNAPVPAAKKATESKVAQQPATSKSNATPVVAKPSKEYSPLPPSPPVKEEEPAMARRTTSTSVVTGAEAFVGEWHRTAQINYAAVLEAIGLTEKECQIALNSDMKVKMNVLNLVAGDQNPNGPNQQYFRIKEQTGGLSSSSSGLNFDCTYDVTPEGGSVNNAMGRRDSTRTGGTKIWGERYFDSVSYSNGDAASAASGGMSRYGDVLTITRTAVSGKLSICNKYCIVRRGRGSPERSGRGGSDHAGHLQLKITTVCTRKVPQFKGGPLVDETIEGTTVMEQISSDPGTELVVKPLSTPSAPSTPAAPSSPGRAKSTSGVRSSTKSVSEADIAAAEAAGIDPEVLKKRRLISGMWVQFSGPSNKGGDEVGELSTVLTMQEVLFNQSMSKVQIGELTTPKDVNMTSPEDIKKKTLYKVTDSDSPTPTTRDVDFKGDGVMVTVQESVYWDTAAPSTLVICHTDRTSQREVTYFRHVEKDGDQAITAAGSPKKRTSRVYSAMRLRRVERDLSTRKSIASERVFKRKLKAEADDA